MAEYRDDSGILTFLYETVPGRVILKALTAPFLSRAAGKYLDTRHSCWLIPRFVKKNDIDLSVCRKQDFDSFNDFFTRQLKEEERPVTMDPETFISPCDGRLSVYDITEDAVFTVKGSRYSVSDFLGGSELAFRYAGGKCLIIRLCVNDYHRYHYLDSGHKDENHYIPGVLHTVRPIALRNFPVFIQNAREYTTLFTENFGAVTQVEVGAILIGRIANHHGKGLIVRGEEKGKFLYGGSTVVLLLEPGKVDLLPQYPADGEERQVRFGAPLGHRSK